MQYGGAHRSIKREADTAATEAEKYAGKRVQRQIRRQWFEKLSANSEASKKEAEELAVYQAEVTKLKVL